MTENNIQNETKVEENKISNPITPVLVPDNFFDNKDIEDTTETVLEFIPPVDLPYNLHQDKHDLYDKILGLLSISKCTHLLIYTDEKIPYKQDYLYKRIIGVRLSKEIIISTHYEHHGLYADGYNDITINKIKPYERVYVEVQVINPDGTSPEWKQCSDMKNIMVKNVEYLVIK